MIPGPAVYRRRLKSIQQLFSKMAAIVNIFQASSLLVDITQARTLLSFALDGFCRVSDAQNVQNGIPRTGNYILSFEFPQKNTASIRKSTNITACFMVGIINQPLLCLRNIRHKKSQKCTSYKFSKESCYQNFQR